MIERWTTSTALALGSAFADTWTLQVLDQVWPLWLCSVVLTAMVIDRARHLKASRILDPEMMAEVIDHLSRRDVAAAQQRAATSNSVIARAWEEALSEFSLGGISLMETLTQASVLALKPLKRNLQAISTIAAIAPLLGLLGTIVGIILAFSRIADTGGANKSQLAGAISLALFTTAGGILVAIPAIIAGRYFSAKLVTFAEQVEISINRAHQSYQHALARASTEPGAARADLGDYL